MQLNTKEICIHIYISMWVFQDMYVRVYLEVYIYMCVFHIRVYLYVFIEMRVNRNRYR